MDVRKLLAENILVMDGAMGTMLQDQLRPGEPPEVLNITNPDAVRDVHTAYFAAGSHMVLTNTFGANRRKLSRSGYTPSEVVEAAMKSAKSAALAYNGLVALDIGPLGELMEPMGTLRFDDAYAMFRELVVAGSNAGADAIVIETMTDLIEIKCALLAAKENTNLPVFCTMSFGADQRTFMGVSLSAMAVTLSALGADAIGVNCSVGPLEVFGMVSELMKWTDLPIIAKPNAGLPRVVEGETVFQVDAAGFASQMERLLELGVSMVGGCCGTTPAFIKALSILTHNRKPTKREIVTCQAASSQAKTVPLDRIRVIGGRIDPAQEDVRQALLDNDMDWMADLAMEQVEDGADIIDVSVGTAACAEQLMADVVRSVQSVVNVPLRLRAVKPEVLEAGLRVYIGRPLVAPVDGSPDELPEFLTIVRKYGAVVFDLPTQES